MKDTYGRKIDYMRISVTDRCNLRCRYCMPEGIALVSMRDILTYEEIELVCRAAAKAGISKLKITGGEPLVRFGCAELVGRLKKIPGIRQVTMTTNGVLLQKYLPRLLENGLDAVNISLDTLKPEQYQQITGKPELPVVLEAIRQAAATGLRVKINCVLLKGMNDGEWQEFAEWTKQMPIDVRFIEMMPIGYGKDYAPVYNEILLEKLKRQYPDVQKDEQLHGNGPAVYYKIKGAKGSIGFISAMHGKFCGSCNRLRLTSQGKLKPCLCYGEEIDLMRILRGEKEPLLEQMEDAFYQAILQKPRDHQFEASDRITEKKQMVQIGG